MPIHFALDLNIENRYVKSKGVQVGQHIGCIRIRCDDLYFWITGKRHDEHLSKERLILDDKHLYRWHAPNPPSLLPGVEENTLGKACNIENTRSYVYEFGEVFKPFHHITTWNIPAPCWGASTPCYDCEPRGSAGRRGYSRSHPLEFSRRRDCVSPGRVGVLWECVHSHRRFFHHKPHRRARIDLGTRT